MVDRRTSWGLLLVGTLSYVLLMFAWFSLAAYLSIVISDLGLSDTQAGLITGAVPLTYIPVALLSGPLIDRIGPYRAIGYGMGILGVAQIGRSTALGFASMLAFTILLGIGGSGISFGLPKLVSDLFPVDGGTPSSVYIMGSIVGNAAAFTVGRGVLGPVLGGWRPLFLATGVASLAYVAVWGSYVRRTSPDRSGTDTVEAFRIDAIRRDVATVVSNPSIRLLIVVGVAYLMTLHGVQNWLTTVLEARGFSPAVATTATSGFIVAQAVGTLALPPITDRLDRVGGIVVLCGVGCTVGIVTLLAEGAPLLVPAVGIAIAGIGVGGLSPLVRLIPTEIDGIGPALTGTAVGVTFSFGQVGGFLAPFLIGTLQDLTGSYVPGFLVLSVACLAAVVAAWRLPV